MTAINQYVEWFILATGLLSALYGIASTALARPSGSRPKVARGFYVWPNSISSILAALVTVVALALVRATWGVTAGIGVGFLVGWALLFLLFFASRAVGRKLAMDGSGPNQARLGYGLLSASGLTLSACALLGGAVVLADSPAWQTLGVRQILALALGFWLAATFWSLPSALYRWLLSREISAGPGEISPLSVQFRSTPGETAFLAAAALACGIALAEFRFASKDIPGQVYPLAAFAVSMVFAMLVSPLLAPPSRRASRLRAVLQWLGVCAFVTGTGLSAYLLAERQLHDIRGFYAFGIGLATAMLLMLTARSRPPFAQIGSPFGVEIAVAQVLMVLAAAVLAFRWMAGYGIALCTIGLLSSLPILFPIGALWAARRTTDDPEEADLPFMAHAASRFAEIVTAGGSFLLIVALLRLFRERGGLGTAGVDITDPYPLIGLVIGGSFPILMKALTQANGVQLSVATFDRSTLVSLGRWAAFRTLGMWLLAGIVPLLVGFFGRMESAGAFLVGLAAAELFLIVALWLGEVRNAADEGIRLATRVAHMLSVGSALITVLLVPPLARMTEEVSRTTRAVGLAGVFVVALVVVLLTAYRRQKTERK